MKKKSNQWTYDESLLAKKVLRPKQSSLSKREFNDLSAGLRFQRGMSDRYLSGLENMYYYLDFIQAELKKWNVPIELAYLPHVESSFNFAAYSRVGAAGIWQFIPSAARLYNLKIDPLVDERRDPIKSTAAAARMLKDNYLKLREWPLAITAYNTGHQRMVKAVHKLKTNSLSKIIQKFIDPGFQFASKSFYACFIAAAELALNHEYYFPKFVLGQAVTFEEIILNGPYTLLKVAEILEIPLELLVNYNLKFKPSAIQYGLALPKGTVLRVPKGKYEVFFQHMAKNPLPPVESDKETFYIYRLKSHEKISAVAKKYKVSEELILKFNNIQLKHNRYKNVGKEILIPLQVDSSTTHSGISKTLRSWEKSLAHIVKSMFTKNEEEPTSTTPVTILSPPAPSPEKENQEFLITEDVLKGKYDLNLNYLGNDLYSFIPTGDETDEVILSRLPKADRKLKRYLARDKRRVKLIILPEEIAEFKNNRFKFLKSKEKSFFEQKRNGQFFEYTTTQDETWENLAKKFNVPVWALQSWQKLHFGKRIPRGTTLRIIGN